MAKSFMADMSWIEFQEALDPGTVLVIPLGSTELEGPHLPLGVDTIAAQGVARGLAGEEGVLIAPCLPLGYSKWFHPYAGTVSLEHDTLVKVLLDYCRSLAMSGVKRVVFLNSHKGNNSAVEVAAHTLIQERGLKVGMLNVWKLANDLTAGKELINEGGFTHAGEIMTSVMLALKPEAVTMDQAKPGGVKPLTGSGLKPLNSTGDTAYKGVVQTVYQDIRQVTDNGTLGDPSGATAEKGRAVLDLIVDYAKGFLQEFRGI
jgi:creatinine amidohydrolase